jgi:hypothetical protein
MQDLCRTPKMHRFLCFFYLREKCRMRPMLRISLTVLFVGTATVLWLTGGHFSAPNPLPIEPTAVEQLSGLTHRENTVSRSKAESKPARNGAQNIGEPGSHTSVIDEQTLVNTTWGRDGFELEFGPGGVLLIGGRKRANWEIIGEKIRLYNRRGEEHWLNIQNGQITWNGQEVGRVK